MKNKPLFTGLEKDLQEILAANYREPLAGRGRGPMRHERKMSAMVKEAYEFRAKASELGNELNHRLCIAHEIWLERESILGATGGNVTAEAHWSEPVAPCDYIYDYPADSALSNSETSLPILAASNRFIVSGEATILPPAIEEVSKRLRQSLLAAYKAWTENRPYEAVNYPNFENFETWVKAILRAN